MIGTRGEGGAGVTFAADNINTDVVGALNKAGGQGIGVSDGLPGGARVHGPALAAADPWVSGTCKVSKSPAMRPS